MLKENGIDARCVRGSGNLKDESGDILIHDVNGKWLMECKHWSQRTATPGEIRKAWIGICKQANKERCKPVLQLRINRKPNRYRVLLPSYGRLYEEPELWAEMSEKTFIMLMKDELRWDDD